MALTAFDSIAAFDICFKNQNLKAPGQYRNSFEAVSKSAVFERLPYISRQSF